MPVRVAIPPAEEPLTLEEAKAQCRIDGLDEDTYLTGLILQARRWCEKYDRRAYVTQGLEMWLDAWPGDGVIRPERPPLQSVTSIVYYDANDNAATLSASAYIVDAISQPGRIVLRTGSSWPTATLRAANGICVTYLAGYGTAVDVPEEVKGAMKLLIGHWYENREDSTTGAVNRAIDFGAKALLGIDRAFRF
jgi:uncharacterized phiE125 gp8 family phage protein